MQELFTRRNLVVTGVLVVVLLGAGAYALTRPDDATNGQATSNEAQRIVAAVGKLMVLPTNEEPIIATVADPSKLVGQAFFVNAKRGDRVLVYNIARKAILYDEIANKIVDVAPLSATPGPSPSI